MTQRFSNQQAWIQFAIVSAFYFHITGSTFTSFGVVLPYMIEDMGWSWAEAGTGFSLLALVVGLASAAPAWSIRKLGLAPTYAIGSGIMALGFALLALTHTLELYYLGAGLLGLGFPFCALVPGVHIVNMWLPQRRSFAIGAYFTIGGLGGVAGPQIVTAIVTVTESWRLHWWVMAASILALAVIALLLLKAREDSLDTDEMGAEEKERVSPRVYKTQVDWSFGEAIRTYQYYVIVAALTITLFCGLTVNSWAVSHMISLGVTNVAAAGALSAQAGINSFSRVLGGALATRIDPKWLLTVALVAEAIGMVALVSADDPVTIALFAFGEGFGFGMCLYATTVILVNYFGSKDTPELLGTMNVITTAAMVGPVLGGYIADTYGGFAPVFQVYGVAVMLIAVLVIAMRPPQYTKSPE